MQVALCTLHDDSFQRAEQSLLCTKKILELESQAIISRTDIKQAYMGCQLFTAITQNKKDVSDEAYSI